MLDDQLEETRPDFIEQGLADAVVDVARDGLGVRVHNVDSKLARLARRPDRLGKLQVVLLALLAVQNAIHAPQQDCVSTCQYLTSFS